MKILKNKGRIIIVATGATDPKNCPRLIVNEGVNEIRDDYRGSIKVPKKLLYEIF